MIENDWIIIDNSTNNISQNWQSIYSPFNFAGNVNSTNNIVYYNEIINNLGFKNLGFNIKNTHLIEDRINKLSKYFTIQYMIKKLHNTLNTNRVLIGFKIMHDCHFFYH
tara:strand:- start:405 stop:731 length:327 start_codon:yes stop_codon:yes gene_type:complete